MSLSVQPAVTVGAGVSSVLAGLTFLRVPWDEPPADKQRVRVCNGAVSRARAGDATEGDGALVCSALAPVAAIIPPPPDIQPVIDKLAEYVARNGLKFETSVRAKNDQR